MKEFRRKGKALESEVKALRSEYGKALGTERVPT
jgi:hypothetical protein